MDLPRWGLEGGVGERRRGGRWWRGQQTAVGGGRDAAHRIKSAGGVQTHPQADMASGKLDRAVAPESRGGLILGGLPAELQFPQRL